MIITEENFAILARDTHIGKWVKDSKRLDFDQSALKTYLPFFKEGDVLLNIGANIGSYSYAFKDKASKIICFEPSAELFECLRYNLEKYSNIELYNEAMSDTNEPYEVICLNDNVGMTHIKISDKSSKITRTIDSYSFDKIDFILMDCEGYEPKILSGAQNTISKYRPILIIEINIHTLKEYYGYDKSLIYDFLDQNNYKYRNIYENHSMEGDQFDIICFPRERLEL
jgi:FkbM family methyltransferase